ncbi:MAG: AAA family ATPase [Chloroflexi bacterium]|nr:AAA family ATPase [Chloroflexota bacterium]
MIHELQAAQVRRTIDPASLAFETTATVKPLEGIIGQARAVAALQFGLGIPDGGFNIYVAGLPGIGKMTAVEAFLDEIAEHRPLPDDWGYVNNFDDAYQPRALKLPPGRGRTLQQDMKELIADARREIPKAFESEPYNAKREEIRGGLSHQRDGLLSQFGERAMQSSFTLEVTPLGIVMLPTKAGRPLNEQEFSALSPQEREVLKQKHQELQAELDTLLKRGREMERAARDKLQELDQQVALYVVGGLIQDLAEKYHDLPAVTEFIEAVKRDLLQNIELFQATQVAAAALATGEAPIPSPWLQELPFRKYQVNVLVDHSNTQGAPVIVELNPNYNNLFGRVEKETHYGALYTDHTMIKAGALHRANGGFLVIPVQDLLTNPYSWDGLKRVLRGHEIEIEDLGDRLGILSTKSLRPQPIPLALKVILIGSPLIYHLLYVYDEEFGELFKVQADFDSEMDFSGENIADFASFVRTLGDKENLKPLDRTAVAALLEHALRLAEDHDKLSTQFGLLADVIREANYWAEQAHATTMQAEHIQRALDQKMLRSNLIQDRIQEMIVRGTLVVETDGTQVGQVNGLSVLGLGNYRFGRPSRITASVAPGREGIVDIEREVALGGPIHSKGVLILSGYLARTFAQDTPLTLSARLVFEQSYEGVEGDSASSAELYALVSALAEVPLKQNIAVTGALDQAGHVQAIGGVNEKIEGFFEVCQARGLTGAQGVVIPASNARDLMLRRDVVDAIARGQFHIWTVESVSEGIELLTGLPTGERDTNGKFPADSINARVARRLEEFARVLKRTADGDSHAKAPPRTILPNVN